VTQPRLYDMVFLVTPDKDEQGVLAVVDDFRKLLVENGAKIQKDETMGRRRLAFQIRKKNEATYHNFMFNGDAKCVAEVQRKLRLSEDVLRFLTVRVDEEMKHGQKVTRNTKPRTPRRVETPGDGSVAPAPSAPDAGSGEARG
jgi:small subunit ribosomal protein S6